MVWARFEGWEEFAYTAIGCLVREYWVFFFIPECHRWDRFGLRREKGCDRPFSAAATLVFHIGLTVEHPIAVGLLSNDLNLPKNKEESHFRGSLDHQGASISLL